MSTFRISVNGIEYAVQVSSQAGNSFRLQIGDQGYDVRVQRDVSPQLTSPLTVTPVAPVLPRPASTPTTQPGEIVAPMPGIVVSVEVQPGQQVRLGQTLVIIEAMKMENPIVAPSDGVVREILVTPKSEVPQGQRLLLLQPA
ncbi:MAG: biotin/lipoyl-containing protein [Bdellovibrionota bacterium]|nr:MAG: biotin/lipoyl-containing protein [Bdellovibrionota bacterium]